MVPAWITSRHLDAAPAKAARDASRKAPVLVALHGGFIPDHGLRMTGQHHEVYLSDPRRTPTARLRTILRQPVVR